MKLYFPKLAKFLLGVFVFFLAGYIVLDLLFNVSNLVEVGIGRLPANPTSALIIIGLLVADILIPIPSSIVMVASGILFGPILGGLVALTGSLIGSLLNFQISRAFGRERVQGWLKNDGYDRLSSLMQKYGAVTVILTRMVPIAMESVSSIAGLSLMKFRKFIILNLIGFTPIVFLYSSTGAIYKNTEPQNIFIVLTAGFLVPLAVWLWYNKIVSNG
ncbi:hypothetical protein A2617_00130 [Candidatus Daviesbacteria bacterium RIFOXYD1_FULL_41_10]|uniref:TVP38/TMEM64 family membrane protein n=2 Tax=Candidatus Daviesiibacteriota TaxID=1752718 RepID=A0A1F5N138_9BACT|nr:MAG: hypothetical protein UU67_C0026G0016 [Candidatus Daviesbacteria bacterium GW2011_GWB1_41_5]OGE71335.1 MAG: hypothetical protein A2617_00130 [Candidatus Daviesbacteria bacterium RIFOXYD1_FULL_41_10]